MVYKTSEINGHKINPNGKIISGKDFGKHVMKFKKVHPDAKIPAKGFDNDGCYDCVATSMKDYGDGRIAYGLGFAIEMPKGGRVDIRPRSSISKHGLVLANSPATIDYGYSGEIMLVFYKIIPSLPNYAIGDRIGQLHFEMRNDIVFVEVDQLSDSDRGQGGFGSTGQ